MRHMHNFARCACAGSAPSYSPASRRIAVHIVPAAWHQSLLRSPLSGVVKRDPSGDPPSRERKDSDLAGSKWAIDMRYRVNTYIDIACMCTCMPAAVCVRGRAPCSAHPLFKREADITASCAFLRRLLLRACRSVMRGWCIGIGGGVGAVDMRGERELVAGRLLVGCWF